MLKAKAAVLVATVTLFALQSTLAIGQEVPKGFRAIDLMRECQGRGEQYEMAVASGIPEPEAMGAADLYACISYLAGIVDMNALIAAVLGSSVFCFPKSGISGEQQILVFLKWAQEHPEHLHESRRMAVVQAMVAAFPCRSR